MTPQLSIIITNYNYTDRLPTLFDNIMSQSLNDFEVIVVDDCSVVKCSEIVQIYQNKGMNLRLVENPTRQYTKESRLNGVEASTGTLITFIDADDIFYGTKALKYHVDLACTFGSEITHFAIYHTEGGKGSRKKFPWTAPIGNELMGREIFNVYVSNNCDGHTICGKIIKRDLWERCLKPARNLNVHRYGEDLALSSLLFFHAKSYLGSSRLGYQREWINKVNIQSLGYAVTHYVLMKEFIPYIINNGCDQEIALKLQNFFTYHLKKYAYSSIENLRQNKLSIDEYIDIIVEKNNYEILFKTIMTGIL